MDKESKCTLENLLVFSVMVLIILTVFSFFMCQCNDKTDKLYQYSHHISIGLTSEKTSLEHWHQSLIDSTFAATDWNHRYLSPIVSVNIDTVKVGYQVEIDSLAKCLSRIDQLYKEYYNDAISDLRQESNNLISKWSAWFGFWLSLLALLVGIVPLVLQFKISGKNKEFLKNEVEKQKNEIEIMKKDLMSSYEQKKNEIDQTIVEIKKHIIRSKVVNEISAIDIGKNNKLLKESPDRVELLRFLMKDLRVLLASFINEYKRSDNYKDEDKKNDLIVVLIEIHGVVTKLLPSFKNLSVSRKVHKLLDESKFLIFDLVNTESEKDKIEMKLDKIQNLFSDLVDEFK